MVSNCFVTLFPPRGVRIAYEWFHCSVPLFLSGVCIVCGSSTNGFLLFYTVSWGVRIIGLAIPRVLRVPFPRIPLPGLGHRLPG